MKCDLAPGIKSMSGKSGGVLFKTFRKPDGSKQTRAYLLPRKKNGQYGSKRKTPVTEKERAQRIAFTNAAEYASKIVKDSKSESFMSWYNIWKAKRMTFQGKTYATLRGFIMAYALAAIKAGIDINEQPDIPNL